MLMFCDLQSVMAAGIWAWFGSCVPRFSHRRSLYLTFLHVFANGQLMSLSFPGRHKNTEPTETIPVQILPLMYAELVRSAWQASPDNQNVSCQNPEVCVCVPVFSANATQRLLSAGIRQSTRRLCTRIGCWSRAPVGSSQSQAMKDCALTADQRARA